MPFNLIISSWAHHNVSITNLRVTAKPVTFVPPIAPVEPSKLVDEDAEAVKAKAQEEQREQEELEKMSVFDRPEEIQRDVQFGDDRIFSDDGEMEKPPTAFGAAMDSSGASSSTFNVAPSPSLMPSSSTPHLKHGMDVPATPLDPGTAAAPVSPRTLPATREHETEMEAAESKRAKTEDHKKQRVERLAAEQEKMIRTIKFGGEEYYTLDSYDAEPTSEQSELETGDEIWADEEELHFAGVDERLWSSHDLKQQPPPPGEEVDKLADEVEIGRLMDMRVLVKPKDHDGPVQGHLTTKFVRDWRKKVYVDLNGGSCERWMRRSRLVAREYANTKRDDTFSPATGAHTSNLLPVFFLDLHKQAEDCNEQYKALLASLDIKDAFLQVPQTQQK